MNSIFRIHIVCSPLPDPTILPPLIYPSTVLIYGPLLACTFLPSSSLLSWRPQTHADDYKASSAIVLKACTFHYLQQNVFERIKTGRGGKGEGAEGGIYGKNGKKKKHA